MNNHRIAIWSDIEQAILVRIAENERNIAAETENLERLVILRRIAADDLRRLAEARKWIVRHQAA
jgi:hypothetical protein